MKPRNRNFGRTLQAIFLTAATVVAGVWVAWGGDHRGNGGDVVRCAESFENAFKGYYSIDYLVTYSTSIVDMKTHPNYRDHLSYLVNILKAKFPLLGASFEVFVADYRNTRDPSRRFYWEEAPFGLKDLIDEELVNQVPSNCLKDGALHLEQAIVWQDPSQSGVREGTTVLKFSPKHLDILERQAPLQLSYLLVHEWLWEFSKKVERNRRVNRFLHTAELESMPPEMAKQRLRAFGMDPDHPHLGEEPAPIPTAVLMCRNAVGPRDIIERRFLDNCQRKECVDECASDQFTVETRQRPSLSQPATHGHTWILCVCRVPGMGKGSWSCRGTRQTIGGTYEGKGDSRYAAEMDVIRQCGTRRNCDIEKCTRNVP